MYKGLSDRLEEPISENPHPMVLTLITQAFEPGVRLLTAYVFLK